jgi:membrane protein implicated in regulation of membrane protease activity
LAEKEENMPIMFWIWLGITIVAVIVELGTQDLSSIWFAGGGIVAMLMSISPKVPWWASLIVFLGLSLALLLSLRKITKKYLNKNSEGNTNLELLVGKEVHVTQPGNYDSLATVKVNGLNWGAKTEKGEELVVGDLVKVLSVQGNKLIVEKIIDTKTSD